MKSIIDKKCLPTFFPQLRLPLLDRHHDHVTAASLWQTVQSTLDAMYGDDVQVLCTLKRPDQIFRKPN